MFGISFPELVVICVIALIVFGPEKLPEVLRWVGTVSGQVRKTSEGLRREFYNAVYEPAKDDLNKARAELSSLKAEFSTPYRLEPSCPDTIAKRESALQSSASTLLTAETAALGTASQALQPSKEPVVDIPVPVASKEK